MQWGGSTETRDEGDRATGGGGWRCGEAATRAVVHCHPITSIERDIGGEYTVPLVRGSHCGSIREDLYNIYPGPQGCREKRRAQHDSSNSSQDIRRGRRYEDAADDRHGEQTAGHVGRGSEVACQ